MLETLTARIVFAHSVAILSISSGVPKICLHGFQMLSELPCSGIALGGVRKNNVIDPKYLDLEVRHGARTDFPNQLIIFPKKLLIFGICGQKSTLGMSEITRIFLKYVKMLHKLPLR